MRAVPMNSSSDTVTIPPEFATANCKPLLLPGESVEAYEALRGAILSEIAPKSPIEWLLALDLVELSWDVERYRVLRHKLLQTYRQDAIEQALRRIDLAGIPSGQTSVATCQIKRTVASWADDPSAAFEIEARLESRGYDQHALNMSVHVQARELFHLFESLLSSAQQRRLLLLREINKRRSRKNDNPMCEGMHGLSRDRRRLNLD
jgi:hypothetical protein